MLAGGSWPTFRTALWTVLRWATLRPFQEFVDNAHAICFAQTAFIGDVVQVDIRSCALEFSPEIASFKPRRLSLALRVLAHPHDAAGRREALNGYPGIERGFLDKILSCHSYAGST